MNRLALIATIALAAPACMDHSQLRLRTAVDAQRPSLTQCYENALAQSPSAQGRMTLLIHIPTGAQQVARVQVGESDRPIQQQQQLQQCVADALVGLPIGSATLAELNVEYTLSFVPDPTL